MVGLEVVFWACFLLVAHTYLLYPVSLFVASAAVQTLRDWQYLVSRRDRRRTPRDPVELPAVSFIIPAYNEERHLPAKSRFCSSRTAPPTERMGFSRPPRVGMCA